MNNKLIGLKKQFRRIALYFVTKRRKNNKILRKICALHKSDWIPLTEEEKKNAYAKDYDSYQYFKNFGNDGRYELSDFVTTAEFVGEYLPRLNKLNHTLLGSATHTLFVDKNYSKTFFPEFTHPKAVVRRICGVYYDEEYHRIDHNTALELLNEHDALVFKISRDSYQGKGVRKIEREGYRDALDQYGENYVVQEIIKQHETFSYFNPSSVNVVRIISLYWNGEVYLLCAKFKVGAPGGFVDLDVTDEYPVEIGINDDGSFDKRAFEAEYRGEILPTVFGKEIKGTVPNFELMKNLVKQAHSRYPDYGILGWDLTVDKDNNVVFIEVNGRAPAVDDSQCIKGPFFSYLSKDGRKLKDEILETPLDYQNLRII